MDLVHSYEQELAEEGQVLLRYSGTEPLLRLMVQGPDIERLKIMAHNVELQVSRDLL
jgi:phosphoglucosamine mutase